MTPFWQQVIALLRKDFQLEWRQQSAFHSVLLYMAGSVFIVYLSFGRSLASISPLTWNAVLWVILLFASLQAIGKSFQQEPADRFYFYYSMASATAIVFSKWLYNVLLQLVLFSVGLGVYLVVMGNPVQDFPLFAVNLGMGAVAFSSILTTISAIAAKAGNNTALVSILGFPVVLPVLLLLLRVSRQALDGLARSVSTDELISIAAISVIGLVLSLLLFPYLWRS